MRNRHLLRQFARAVLPRAALAALDVHRGLRSGGDPETRLLPLLERGGAFVDVGANRGSWCGPAARVFRKVHAFEPEPALAAALRRAAPSNVTVYALALSDHDGSGRFAVPVYGGEALTTRASLETGANVGHEDELVYEVPLARLDSFELTQIDVIKIDVEGHERAVLDGAWRTIDRERPTLIVEIEERHHLGESESIIAGLVTHGYQCSFLGEEGLQRFTPGSIGTLQPPDRAPLPGRHIDGYVNNFVFLPLERQDEFAVLRERMASGIH